MSIFGCNVLVPPGPLSDTSAGEMLSSFQPFSASPTERERGFAPVTAKIASRRSGSITIPLSLTSFSVGSAGPSDLAVSGRRLGLNSGRARIVGTESFAVGCGATRGAWLLCTAGSPWSVAVRVSSVSGRSFLDWSSKKISPARPTDIVKRKSSWRNPLNPYHGRPIGQHTYPTLASQ